MRSEMVGTKPRILLIDDEPIVLKSIVNGLGALFDFAPVNCISVAKKIIPEFSPHLVVLDIKMGSDSGLEFCHQLRSSVETKQLPILMMSGFTDSNFKKKSFQSGADDFIEKPIRLEELQVRIVSKLRRWQDFDKQNYNFEPRMTLLGNAVLNSSDYSYEVEGERIQLSKIEFELLQLLANNKGRVLSRDKILDQLWGETAVGKRTIDAHLAKLRKKTSAMSYEIASIYGAGFILRQKR
jgi:DNA-binding response OmpR family regulator